MTNKLEVLPRSYYVTQGKNAYLNKQRMKDNPYPYGSRSHTWWYQGFVEIVQENGEQTHSSDYINDVV